MKHAVIYSVLLLLVIGVSSCEKEDPVPDYKITGEWDFREAFIGLYNFARHYEDFTITFFDDGSFHLKGIQFGLGYNGKGIYRIVNSQKKIYLEFDDYEFTFCSGLDYEFIFNPSPANQAVFNAMEWKGNCNSGQMDFDLRRK